MGDRINVNGIERELRNIADNLNKPFQDEDNQRRHDENIKKQNELILDDKRRHDENIKKQNELIKEQTSLVRWTKFLAIFTILLAGGTIYMAVIQTPMPKLMLDVKESRSITCVNNTALPYGPSVKVANVGTRSSFNTELIITYEEPNSFYDAFFVKYSKFVNRTNPNVDLGWVYPQEGIILGSPYWIVDTKKTTIFLNEIEPGEIFDLVILLNGRCGITKDVAFKVTEKGYHVSSDVKNSRITWVG